MIFKKTMKLGTPLSRAEPAKARFEDWFSMNGSAALPSLARTDSVRSYTLLPLTASKADA